ncbi:MAG: NUDIX domain-containing protein, partial [Bacteroidota bacterium]
SAREIVERWGGEFPGTFARIRELKGIGDYSAASIASLAFNEPEAAVDGNVFRFLARYFGYREPAGSSVGTKRVKKKAEELMDIDNPGTFNQAMIEFGALVCTPAHPSCNTCIFKNSCNASRHQTVMELPVKTKSVKIRTRYFHYLVMTFQTSDGIRIVISKRKGNDIWKNLYDFPLIETTHRLSQKRLMMTDDWKSIFQDIHPAVISVTKEFRHILSHQLIQAKFYRISLNAPPKKIRMHIRVDELDSIPVPKLIAQYIQQYFD